MDAIQTKFYLHEFRGKDKYLELRYAKTKSYHALKLAACEFKNTPGLVWPVHFHLGEGGCKFKSIITKEWWNTGKYHELFASIETPLHIYAHFLNRKSTKPKRHCLFCNRLGHQEEKCWRHSSWLKESLRESPSGDMDQWSDSPDTGGDGRETVTSEMDTGNYEMHTGGFDQVYTLGYMDIGDYKKYASLDRSISSSCRAECTSYDALELELENRSVLTRSDYESSASPAVYISLRNERM